MTYCYCCIPHGTCGSRKIRLREWLHNFAEHTPDSTVIVEYDCERKSLQGIIEKLTENDKLLTYDYACLGDSFYDAYCVVLEVMEHGAGFHDCTPGLFNLCDEDALYYLKAFAEIDNAMRDVVYYNTDNR